MSVKAEKLLKKSAYQFYLKLNNFNASIYEDKIFQRNSFIPADM